jgi:hypothetical protein
VVPWEEDREGRRYFTFDERLRAQAQAEIYDEIVARQAALMGGLEPEDLDRKMRKLLKKAVETEYRALANEDSPHLIEKMEEIERRGRSHSAHEITGPL